MKLRSKNMVLLALLPCALLGSLLSSCNQATPTQIPVQPLGTSWEKVSSQDPKSVKDLVFWISADSIQGVRNGKRIKSWPLNVGSGKPLQLAGKQGPLYLAHAAEGKPAVEFTGDTPLYDPAIHGSSLSADHATALVVLKLPPSGPLHDIFGWGNCQKNRFLMHACPTDQTFFFQQGDPVRGHVRGTCDFKGSKTFHVIAAVRNGSIAEIDVDGERTGQATGLSSALDLASDSGLMIGNSPCNNHFDGEIAEMMIFKTALSRPELDGLTKYLATKYRIPLR